MRVAIVTSMKTRGGTEIASTRLAKLLIEQGHDIKTTAIFPVII